MSTDPFTKRAGESRTLRLNFGNQPEIAQQGDQLTGAPVVAVMDAPGSSGTVPTLGTAAICGPISALTLSAAGSGYTPGTYALAFAGGGSAALPSATGAYTVGPLSTNPTGAVTSLILTYTAVDFVVPPTVSFPSGGGTGAAATTTLRFDRVRVPVSGGIDNNSYSLKWTCATVAGSILEETTLLLVRPGPDP